MSNIYVGQFKDILKGYYKKQQEYNAKIEDNNKRFTPEYAEAENAKIREAQSIAYNKAKESIDDVFQTVKGLLANASFISGDNRTKHDYLFSNDSVYDLSADEVQSYVDMYAKNYDFLRMVNDWVIKHNEPTTEHPAGKYTSVCIITPSDMVHAYKKFGEGALSIVEKINNNGGIMKSPIEINTYDDERLVKDLLTIVGSGMDLIDYRAKNVPERAKHIFDHINLNGADPNFYAR